MKALRVGDRVVLTADAAYIEGRGLPGTVVHTWGRLRKWAVVDVDHHGEITLPVSELEPVSSPAPSWIPPLVDGPTGPGMG